MGRGNDSGAPQKESQGDGTRKAAVEGLTPPPQWKLLEPSRVGLR